MLKIHKFILYNKLKIHKFKGVAQQKSACGDGKRNNRKKIVVLPYHLSSGVEEVRAAEDVEVFVDIVVARVLLLFL